MLHKTLNQVKYNKIILHSKFLVLYIVSWYLTPYIIEKLSHWQLEIYEGLDHCDKITPLLCIFAKGVKYGGLSSRSKLNISNDFIYT